MVLGFPVGGLVGSCGDARFWFNGLLLDWWVLWYLMQVLVVSGWLVVWGCGLGLVWLLVLVVVWLGLDCCV